MIKKFSRIYTTQNATVNTKECNQIIHAHISKFVIIFLPRLWLFTPLSALLFLYFFILYMMSPFHCFGLVRLLPSHFSFLLDYYYFCVFFYNVSQQQQQRIKWRLLSSHRMLFIVLPFLHFLYFFSFLPSYSYSMSSPLYVYQQLASVHLNVQKRCEKFSQHKKKVFLSFVKRETTTGIIIIEDCLRFHHIQLPSQQNFSRHNKQRT